MTDLEITAVAPGKVAVVFTDPVDRKKTQIDFKVKRIGRASRITDIIDRAPRLSSLVKILSHKIP